MKYDENLKIAHNKVPKARNHVITWLDTKQKNSKFSYLSG